MTGRDECSSWSCGSPSTSTWTYDPPNATGRLASRTGGGLAQTYVYRADGKRERVDTRIDVPGVLTATYAQTFGYDAAGRLSSTGHDGTTFTRTYNRRGYLHKVRHGATVLHEFRATDAFGSSTEERLGGGAVHATRSHDPGTGRLASITTGKATTPRSIQDLEYRWRTDGSLHQRIDRRGTPSLADDLTDTFAMDALARVVGQATTGAAVRERGYAYDALHQRIDRRGTPSLADDLTDTFEMDALARVVGQATTGAAVRERGYAYDAFGNLTSKTSGTEGDLDVEHTAATGEDGPYRLTGAAVGGTTTSFTYSGGNVTFYASSDGDTLVEYDAANRVERIAVRGFDGVAADRFWHGPDGSRFLRRETWEESDEERSRLTVYLGALEEARPSHGAHAKVRRIRATGSAVRVERTARDTSAVDARFEYLHRDHLGSVDRITDAAGNPAGSVPSVSFDPFGSHRKADRSADLDAAGRAALRGVEDERSSRGFTDHEHLSRTGFVHMNGRVYDPRLGRFLSPDPVVANPYHSQSWNRYAYVQNRPLSFTDPTGLYMSGSYYGLTADDFNVFDINALMMADLWDYLSSPGSDVRFYQLSTLDSVLTRGLTNAELDVYLATGYDPRRTALSSEGEFFFPEGESQDLGDYEELVALHGVLGDREKLQDLVNEAGNVVVYFNPSHGLLFDLLQALSQRMSPRTDGMARGLARALLAAGWEGKIVAHSQGTLTVVNAVTHFGLGDSVTELELRSPALPRWRAMRAHPEMRYVQPWFDGANVWAPSGNPAKWASGFLDILCGFCVHRANGLKGAL